MKTLLTLLALIGLTVHGTAYAQNNSGQILLTAFQGRCPGVVNRQHTGGLANIQALRSIVEQFRTNDRCFGGNALDSVIGQYNRAYEDYEVYRNRENDKLTLERKIALFTTLLNEPGISTTQIQFLQNEIIYAQADLIGLQTRQSRFSELSGRTPRAADQSLQAINQFLATLANNSSCFSDQRSLAASLLSNSFMATSAFVAPATGLALALGAMTIESLNRFLTDLKFNNLLGSIDEIQMPLALSCAHEAMTTQYCEAFETQSLLRSYGLDRTNPASRQFEGLDLLGRHLSRLDHWLKEVFAGSAITSEGDLINREKPILQAALLEKIKRYLSTYGTIRNDLYASLHNSQERSDAIAIGIENLVLIMQSPSLNPRPTGFSNNSSEVENPIFLTRDARLLPFQLLDPSLTNIPDCPNSSGLMSPCQRLTDYVRNRGILLTQGQWQTSLTNALTVVEAILELVNLDRARTISVDAFTVLVAANQDYRGETNPLQALIKISDNADRIRDYLSAIGCEDRPRDCDAQGRPRFTHRYFPQLTNIDRTQELTLKVIDLLEEAYTPRSLTPDLLPLECRPQSEALLNSFDGPEAKSFQITSCITRLLKLAERGNDVFFTKVRSMVSYEMEARFARGELTDDVDALLSATRSDLVQTLLQTLYPQGEGSLAQITQGLESSMYLGRAALFEFYDIYSKQLEAFFEQGHIPHLNTAEYCLRFIPYFTSLGEKDKLARKVWDKCQNISLQFYADGPVLRFRDLVQGSSGRGPLGGQRFSLHARAGVNETALLCGLRRYYRGNYLYEQVRKQKDEKFTPMFDFVETW
jgi:hypothetical protein